MENESDAWIDLDHEQGDDSNDHEQSKNGIHQYLDGIDWLSYSLIQTAKPEFCQRPAGLNGQNR